MDANKISGLGSALMDFLGEFDDCFGRSEPREHLRTYVSGQLSDLPRKGRIRFSVALLNNCS